MNKKTKYCKPKLLTIIDEHSMINFSGRINVMSQINKQLHGVIFIKNGHVIHCLYKNLESTRAIISILIDEVLNQDIMFIVEPEIIDETIKTINYKSIDLLVKLNSMLQKALENLELRPPANLCLNIDQKQEEANKHDFNGDEKKIVSSIRVYPVVRDLYENCPLLDFEITECLINLRRKKIIKVTGYEEK